MNRKLLIFLDRTVLRVQFWVLAMLARLRAEKPVSEPATLRPDARILVIRPGGLGDGLMAVPFLRALRRALPDAQITVAGVKKNVRSLSILPFHDEIFAIDSPRNLWANYRRIRTTGYDAVFDLEPFRRVSSIVSYLTRSPLRIGFDTNSRRCLSTNLVTYACDKEFDTHNALRQLKVVGVAPHADDADDLRFDLADGVQEQADALLMGEGLDPGDGDLVAVAAGVLKPHHRWVMSEFAALIRMILDHDPATRVVLVGAAGDRPDTDEVVRLLGEEPRVVDLVDRSDFAVSLGVLARCRLLVACDGGVVYMGAAMGCDTLSLWGPGVMERFAPPGRGHIGYRLDYACIPCVIFDRLGEFPPCPYGRRCYNDMKASGVFEQYRKLRAAR